MSFEIGGPRPFEPHKQSEVFRFDRAVPDVLAQFERLLFTEVARPRQHLADQRRVHAEPLGDLGELTPSFLRELAHPIAEIAAIVGILEQSHTLMLSVFIYKKVNKSP